MSTSKLKRRAVYGIKRHFALLHKGSVVREFWEVSQLMQYEEIAVQRRIWLRQGRDFRVLTFDVHL